MKNLPLPEVYQLIEPGPVVLAPQVEAPLIAQCLANLECRIEDTMTRAPKRC